MTPFKVCYSACFLLLGIVETSCFAATERIEQDSVSRQGYVHLTNQIYERTDGNSSPLNLAGGDTATVFNIQRTMYIDNQLLIDAIPNRRVDEKGNVLIDTVEVTLYDLKRQSFIKFKSLDLNSQVMRTGSMKDAVSFSSDVMYDPFNGVSDLDWVAKDTTIDGKSISLVTFNSRTDEFAEYASRVKFWVDRKCVDFPLQMSYILSEKMGGGFVYKMQLPVPDGPSVMVTTFEYQKAALPESIMLLFKEWSKLMQ